MSNEKTKKVLEKIKLYNTGRELFDNRNWYKINKLMIFNLSVYEAVLFSFLADCEQKHLSNEPDQMKEDDYYFLCTSSFIENQLNIPISTQKKYLNNLNNLNFINTKYSTGNKRMIKIFWKVFMIQYKKWVTNYEEELEILKEERKDINIKHHNDRIKRNKKRSVGSNMSDRQT